MDVYAKVKDLLESHLDLNARLTAVEKQVFGSNEDLYAAEKPEAIPTVPVPPGIPTHE
jgi:hypothetical protein